MVQVAEIQGRISGLSQMTCLQKQTFGVLKTIWPCPLGDYAKFPNGVVEITSRLHVGSLV